MNQYHKLNENTDTHKLRLHFEEEATAVREELDKFHKTTGSETIGIGLTSSEAENIQVHDIITPDPAKSIVIESNFISNLEANLVNFLTAHSGEARLVFKASSKELIFNIDKKEFKFERLTVEFISKILNGLVDKEFNLNSDFDTVIPDINKEAVFYGSKIFISRTFIERVKKEASRRGFETDYIIHHHPVPFLLRLLTQDKSEADRVEVYKTSLENTESDLIVANQFHSRLLEIRGLGTVDNAMNENMFTSNMISISRN